MNEEQIEAIFERLKAMDAYGRSCVLFHLFGGLEATVNRGLDGHKEAVFWLQHINRGIGAIQKEGKR